MKQTALRNTRNINKNGTKACTVSGVLKLPYPTQIFKVVTSLQVSDILFANREGTTNGAPALHLQPQWVGARGSLRSLSSYM